MSLREILQALEQSQQKLFRYYYLLFVASVRALLIKSYYLKNPIKQYYACIACLSLKKSITKGCLFKFYGIRLEYFDK